MDKVERILNLISEKSRGLQEELDSMSPVSLNEDAKTELFTQISTLDELYSDVQLIQKQDD